MQLITFCVVYTIVSATRKRLLEPLFFDKLSVSYLGFPLLFAEGRNAALVYSMLFQGSAITSKCVNEYKALEIPTPVCLPVCFSFCTLTFSPSVTSLHKWKLHVGTSIYIGVGYLLSVLHSVTSRHMDICT